MFPIVSRRTRLAGAVATGVALLAVAGCSSEVAEKTSSAVSPSGSGSSGSAEPSGTATSGASSSGLPERQNVMTQDGIAVTVGRSSITLGDVDAATRVLVYQDLACPHCKSLHDALGEDLVGWAAEGSVAVEFVTVDFLGRSQDDFSTQAANLLATVAAHDPASWILVQDAIFAAQPEQPSGAELASLAVSAGAALDDAALADFEDQVYDAFVDASTDAALDAGVQGIPQLFVDGDPVTGATYDEWAQAVRDAVTASTGG